jgi:hypothetical protein
LGVLAPVMGLGLQQRLLLSGVLFFSMLMPPFVATRSVVTLYTPSHKKIMGRVTSSVPSSTSGAKLVKAVAPLKAPSGTNGEQLWGGDVGAPAVVGVGGSVGGASVDVVSTGVVVAVVVRVVEIATVGGAVVDCSEAHDCGKDTGSRGLTGALIAPKHDCVCGWQTMRQCES